MKTPCYQCKDRVIGCRCDKYLTWKENYNKTKEAIAKENEVNKYIAGQIIGKRIGRTSYHNTKMGKFRTAY